MIIVSLLSWWYTIGWKQAAGRMWARIVGLFDFFSIDLLVKTLFSPFRQISAGKVDGPIGVQLRAFVDQLVSRAIGGFVRTITALVGIATLLVVVLASLIGLLVWAVVPIAPIIGLVLMLTGWVPWQL